MSESALPRAVDGPDERHTTSAAIKIDSDIPLPQPAHRGPLPRYPWRTMKPGDSFVYPNTRSLRHTQASANRAVAYRKSDHGETYATRTVTENGERVVRVWRVA